MPVLMPAGYTTDTQAEDYLGLTPQVLYGLIGWTDNLKQLPA